MSEIPNGTAASGSSVLRDVAYAGQSQAQKLDIYLPGGTSGGGRPGSPVIVWIHPGGFFQGDKDGGHADDPLATVDMPALTAPMLARGYAVVSINYRMSGEAPFPALVYDTKAAVRWVKAHAADYGFDPQRVASWGSSAGGYLSAFLAVSEGVPELEDLSLGDAGQSSGVAAAVDWFGPTDFLAMDAQTTELGWELWGGGHDDPASPESLLIGGPIQSCVERCQASNPVRYVTAGHAPLYIQHGRQDDIVPYLQSVQLVEALRAAGGSAEVLFEVVEGVGHANPVFFSTQNIEKVLDFLDRKLG